MSTTSFVKMHPLVAAAAASVIIVSLVGTAAIMDWLPNSRSHQSPEIGAAAGAATPAATSVTPQAAESAVPAQSAKPQTAEPRKPAARSSSSGSAQTAANPPSHVAPMPTPAQPAPVPAQAVTPQAVMPPVAQAPAVCEVCGKVEAVRTIEVAAKPSGVGVVAGAVVGGLLGNQVGGGQGKTLATVAGAVGGGYAGNEIEKRTRKGTGWEVDVRMDNGDKRSFAYDTQPSWKAGDAVKVVDGKLAAR